MNVDNDLWTTIWEELEPADLPGDLEDLARDLGMDATRRLTEHVRGRLYVPSQRYGGETLFGESGEGYPKQLQGIAENVGEDVALYLARHWDGTDLYIPLPETVVRVYRDQHIQHAVRNGWTVQELADLYDISVRHVLRLLESTGEQGDLWSEAA